MKRCTQETCAQRRQLAFSPTDPRQDRRTLRARGDEGTRLTPESEQPRPTGGASDLARQARGTRPHLWRKCAPEWWGVGRASTRYYAQRTPGGIPSHEAQDQRQRGAPGGALKEWRLILGRLLLEERLVDVRDDAAASDGSLDERVELLVTADGKLEVARRNALDAQVLGGGTREFKHPG